MRKLFISLFAITLMITLGACGNNDNNDAEAEAPAQNEPEPITIDDDEKVEDSEVVANVNGNEVSGGVYNVVYTQAKIQLSQLGQDVEEEDVVKEFTLDTLVDQELLRQYAEDLGIEVEEEEVDTEYGALENEDEDQLDSFLEEYQLKEGAFKEQISFSLMHDKYVESELDTSISDDEVEETYDELAEENDEMPDFGEVEDQLREELQMEKEQEALRDIVDELKEEATIEMMI